MWAAKSAGILLWQELPYHNITIVFMSHSGFQQMGFLFMNGIETKEYKVSSHRAKSVSLLVKFQTMFNQTSQIGVETLYLNVYKNFFYLL